MFSANDSADSAMDTHDGVHDAKLPMPFAVNVLLCDDGADDLAPSPSAEASVVLLVARPSGTEAHDDTYDGRKLPLRLLALPHPKLPR